MTLQLLCRWHALAIDEEVPHILKQLRFEGRGIDGVAALHFAELWRTQHPVFAVLTAGQHAADHVAVDGHYWECGRNIGHADRNAIFREDRPDGLFLKHVAVGGNPAHKNWGP